MRCADLCANSRLAPSGPPDKRSRPRRFLLSKDTPPYELLWRHRQPSREQWDAHQRGSAIPTRTCVGERMLCSHAAAPAAHWTTSESSAPQWTRQRWTAPANLKTDTAGSAARSKSIKGFLPLMYPPLAPPKALPRVPLKRSTRLLLRSVRACRAHA